MCVCGRGAEALAQLARDLAGARSEEDEEDEEAPGDGSEDEERNSTKGEEMQRIVGDTCSTRRLNLFPEIGDR